MFDFSEVLIIFALALVVLGPKKLPGAAAQIGKWLGRARAMARQFREQLEEEVNSVKDLDAPRRPPPPVYTPPPSYTPPAPSTTESGTMTHPAPTESPSDWLAQSGTGGAAEAPPEPAASPAAESAPAAEVPAPPATPFVHEDPQISDRSEHERGS